MLVFNYVRDELSYRTKWKVAELHTDLSLLWEWKGIFETSLINIEVANILSSFH